METFIHYVNEMDLTIRSTFFKPICSRSHTAPQGISNASKELVNAIEIQTTVLPTDEIWLLQQLLQQFTDVFSTTAGKFKEPVAKDHLKADARPIFT